MKKILLSCLAIAALMSSSFAADMPVKAPVYTTAVPNNPWTGCYIGANAGGGWSSVDFFQQPSGTSENGHTASGWAAGGQIGCDYQFVSTWVVGVQGMWDWSHLTGSNNSPLFPANALSTNVRSFGTVTGQIGYIVIPAVKLYGKAGIGWVDDHFECNGTSGCAPLPVIASGTRSGFDLGGGVAWMFAPNWDVFVEYDHMWLGNKVMTFTNPLGFFNEGIKQDLSKVLVGVDYRFHLGQ